MHALPALPSHVGVSEISDIENERLESLYGDLPSSSRDCRTCSGTQTFRFYDDMALPAARRTVVDYACPRSDQFILQRFFRLSGVGDRLARLWWGDFDHWPDGTLELAQTYREKMDDFFAAGMGLYLYGEHGTGKSGLASLLFKEALRRGISGYWITWNDLMGRYEDTFRASRDERAWFESRFKNVNLLAIDDMGREYEGRSIAASSVDSILRTRIQLGLPTMVTTNLSHEDFLARYSEGVRSLVTEACLDWEMRGVNYREQLRDRTLREIQDSVRRPFTFG